MHGDYLSKVLGETQLSGRQSESYCPCHAIGALTLEQGAEKGSTRRIPAWRSDFSGRRTIKSVVNC